MKMETQGMVYIDPLCFGFIPSPTFGALVFFFTFFPLTIFLEGGMMTRVRMPSKEGEARKNPLESAWRH